MNRTCKLTVMRTEIEPAGVKTVNDFDDHILKFANYIRLFNVRKIE